MAGLAGAAVVDVVADDGTAVVVAVDGGGDYGVDLARSVCLRHSHLAIVVSEVNWVACGRVGKHLLNQWY